MFCFQLEKIFVKSWWYVFSPLFAADAITLYFSVIVYIRFYLSKKKQEGNKRQAWIMLTLILIFLFEVIILNLLQGFLDVNQYCE